MKGLYGSIRTASALAKSRCELDLASALTGCTATAGTVNMDGTAVTMANRYPTATAAGITVAASIDAGSDGMTAGGTAPNITFSPVGASLASTCVISYTEAVVGASPVVSLDTAGC